MMLFYSSKHSSKTYSAGSKQDQRHVPEHGITGSWNEKSTYDYTLLG